MIFAQKLVKKDKDSGVHQQSLFLQIFLGAEALMVACMRAISFFLVANSLLVLISSLKANCLFISGKMLTKIPSPHTDTIYSAPKLSILWSGEFF
jgi:hypothetical protein